MLRIIDHGSIAVITPTASASESFWAWVSENVGGEYQSWAGGLVVEQGYLGSLIFGLEQDGFEF